MKPSAYLETSVIGAYLDNGEPFRRDLTIRWWEHELSQYRAVISQLVVRELERTEEPHRAAYLKLVRGLEQVELTEPQRTLKDAGASDIIESICSFGGPPVPNSNGRGV